MENLSVRSNQCLSILAWVHLQIRHLGSNVFRKRCLQKWRITASTTSILHLWLSPKGGYQGLLQKQIQPVLLGSLLVSPSENTTDDMGHPKETCQTDVFLFSLQVPLVNLFNPWLQTHILPATCPRETAQPGSCCLGQDAAVTAEWEQCSPLVVPGAAAPSAR